MFVTPVTAPPIQVLLVDDDADFRDLLRTFLQQRGVDVSVLHDATHLERRLERERPSVVVLDVIMPGVDGLTALRQLRARGDTIPVILLSARAEGADRVLGLELGADDYLGKPFLPQELLARISAVLRRPGTMTFTALLRNEQRSQCRFGQFTLDFSSRRLLKNGTYIKSAEGEFALLEIFVTHPMETLSRSRLLHMLYGPNTDVTERGIDVAVWRLRRQIEDDPSNPRRLQTLHGCGYMFVPDSLQDETSA